ncbi:MAG: metallophosphoesterase [Armatimonadota bacterium]|nr:metallophosphoesterase [Armatimonadota bacterium]
MRILHTNDFHGKLTDAKRDRLAELRRGVDFYFDCGDSVKSGNIGVSLLQDPVWPRLASLDCTAGVPGNREFHISEAGFLAKISGCKHPLLAANLRFKDGAGARMQSFFGNSFALSVDCPLASAIIVGDVGIFGVMVPMVTENMSARHLSAFVNDQPIVAARKCVEMLRDQVGTVICLSHIGLRNDVELAESLPGIDVILGAHSHDVVDPPARVGQTWIAQTGSHGRFAGVYEFEGKRFSGRYEPLP